VLVNKRAELAPQIRRTPHCAVPIPDDGLSDERSEVIGILPADALDGNGNVRGWQRVISNADFGADEVWLRFLGRGDGGCLLGWRCIREVSKVLLCEFDKLLVRHAARTDKYHPIGSIVGLDVVYQVIALDALDILRWTQNRAAERLALKGRGMQVVKDNFLKLLIHLFLLPKDDVAFAFDGLRVELGVLEDIGKDVDGLRDIGVEGLGIVDGILALQIVRPRPQSSNSSRLTEV